MNLNKVFANTLGLSLALGLLLFMIGVPICISAMHAFKADEMGDYMFFIAIAMYIVYWPIQIALSIMHLLVSMYWRRTGVPSSVTVLQGLLIAEWLLYIPIYLFLVWALYDKDIWLNIFLFSIPYIIGCTISVYFYKSNYERELAATIESNPELQ